MFIPKLIQVTEEAKDDALTKEYFENYFNYTLSQYIEDENKAKVLLFVCSTR